MAFPVTNQFKLAVIDTTIQIDRRKSKNRRDQIESILSQFDQTLATGLSLVEFKAVLIQECVTIHNQLRRTGARLTHVRDFLCEKNHPQAKLRGHIFHNIIAIEIGSSFDVSDDDDQRAARWARLKLEDVIPRLFAWFKNESATVFWNKKGFACNRAEELPTKKGSTFSPTLPRCVRGKNKTCRVEESIRKTWPAIRQQFPTLDPQNPAHKQLIKSTSLLNEVCDDVTRELSVDDCRCGGDTLIGIEVFGTATHSVSTNRRDWGLISEPCGLTFLPVEYENEETQ